MKKILFIPPEPWYVEHHIEYLIRYFGYKYFMEIGYPGNPQDNPVYENPDDYDLLIPYLATHPHLDTEKYKKKLAAILWEPAEGCWKNTKIVAATTPKVVNSMIRLNHPYIHVLPGIDTNLFQPYPLLKEEKEMVVGIIGCAHNVRHRVKEVVLPLLNIPNVIFKFFVRNYFNDRQNDIEQAGGEEFKKRIANANKCWIGVPNIYNSMDVLLKVDADPGLTFPVLEAMACGKPFVATDVGIEHLFKNCGLVIEADEKDADGNGRNWYLAKTEEVITRARKGIEFLRDNPEARKVLGKNGRKRISAEYTWEKQLPQWDKFFKKALE